MALVLTPLPTQASREEGVDESKVEKDAKVGEALAPLRSEILMSIGGLTAIVIGQ